MSSILIFAFLSFLILYKLFKAFGQVKYINTKQFEKILKEKMINISEEVLNNPQIVKLQETFPEYIDKDIKGELEQIFMTVFKAFVDSRYQDLKSLLSEQLYESFSDRIKKREEKNLRQELDIRDVSAEITHIDFVNQKAHLEVIFKVSQMSATINSDGISFDNPSKLYIDVTHKWKFERPVSATSQWVVIKTNIV